MFEWVTYMGYVLYMSPKTLKFSKQNQGGANHRDFYSAQRFLFYLKGPFITSFEEIFSIFTVLFLYPLKTCIITLSRFCCVVKHPPGNYMFKVNTRNTSVVPVSLLLTWNICHFLFQCFYCKL